MYPDASDVAAPSKKAIETKNVPGSLSAMKTITNANSPVNTEIEMNSVFRKVSEPSDINYAISAIY